MQLKLPQPLPVTALAGLLGGALTGDEGISISGVASPEAAGKGDLTFILSPEAVGKAEKSLASAIVAPPGVEIPGRTVITVENPRYTLALALRQVAPRAKPTEGVHPTAVVAKDGSIGPGTSVGPLVVIGSKAKIGSGVAIGAGSILEDDVEIGEDTTIHPHVTIRRGTRIGRRVEIHPGTVIGSDGFGYVQKSAIPGAEKGFRRYFQKEEPHVKIPQLGNVVIEDDVEIGANVTVDRGTIGPTVLKRGAKIDNLVQIAHNVVVGEHAIVISQAGLSGGVQIGRHATLGGQAGLAEGAQVGEGAIVGAQCGLPPGKVIPPRTAFVGSPGRPAKQFARVTGASARLPQALERLRALEREIRELKKSVPSKKQG